MTAIASIAPAPHFVLAGTAAAITSARRAVVADRYAIDSFATEWLELSQLQSIVGEWRELAARALEPNVFYEPAFALAAAPLFGRDAGAVLVWSGTAPRKLLGLFPARRETRRYGIRLPMLVGWTHPFAPFGTPVVEREAAEPAIAAWLAHVAGNNELPGLLLLPYLPEDGPFAAALTSILRRAQMPAAEFNRHARAMLAPHGNRSDYVEHALGPRQFRELRRTARRLNELGALLFTTAIEPNAVAAATDDFFVLEASGRKDQASAGEVQGFVKAAVTALAAEGKVAVNRVFLDGHSVAVEGRLRRSIGALLARRDAGGVVDRRAGRERFSRANRFLHHSRSSRHEPYMERTSAALRSDDRRAARCAFRARSAAGDGAQHGGRRGRARSSPVRALNSHR
jgi:CelD/BcsL family acetyltransferase involved in cellulose biosynthesis